MKKLAFVLLAFAALLALSTAASAYPQYMNRCSGCSAQYSDLHPYTSYFSNAYSYGYNGWNFYRIHYSYRYPYFNHYYPYHWHYPYAYNYYPRPMYYSHYGYGPGMLW